ncbi:MAG: transposase [Porticoccaceae bacterium]|nr:transposase [Porticoccaceae bacterium]
MNRRPVYSKDVRERAVRLVLISEHDHSSRWAATQSVASKIGCSPETLRAWVNKLEVDSGAKPGITTDHAKRIKELERDLSRA